MTAQPAKVRRIGVGLVAICATLLTSACATGQDAATSEQVPAIDGTSATAGAMQVHALALKASDGPSYPLGSDAELTFVVVNTGTTDDTLTGITSTAFTSSALYKDAADATVVAAAANQPSTSAPSATAAPAGSTSPTDSASPTGTTESASAPAAPISAPAAPTAITTGLTVAAGLTQACGLGADQPVWLLTGLISGPTGTTASPSPLFPAGTVSVTFTFAKAGTVTVPVPVQLRDVQNNATLPALSGSPGE
ncbi:MAG: hypothetical protein ABI232_08625 [Jatrophihabitantaceae bacterium]